MTLSFFLKVNTILTRDKIIFISGSLTSTFIPIPGVGGVKPPVLTSKSSTL